MSKNKDMTPLGKVLGGALPPQTASRLPPPELGRAWARVAGEFLAARSRPVCLNPDGSLSVAVRGSAYLNELNFAAPNLLEKLAESGFTFKRLKLVSDQTSPPPLPEPVPAELTAEEEAKIMARLQGVGDPGLKQSLAAALMAEARARKAGRK